MTPSTLLLVGSTDRQLDEALRTCGMTSPALAGSELAALAQAGAAQPDILVLDLRDQTHLPAALPLLKRQHPATGVIMVASWIDPALLLEAMRAGVNEVVTEPVSVTDIGAAISRLKARRPTTTVATGEVFAFVGAKGGVGTTTMAVNVATVLAKLRARENAADGSAPGERRCGHVSRRRATVLRRRCAREHSSSRRRVLPRPGRSHLLRRGPAVLVRSGHGGPGGHALCPRAHRVRRPSLPLHRAGCSEVRRVRARRLDLATRIVIVANQELATVRNAGRMAGILRSRYRQGEDFRGHKPLGAAGRNRPARCRTAIGGPVRIRFPATIGGR